MINQKKEHFLFMEPDKKSWAPRINDDLSDFMDYLQSKLTPVAGSQTKGFHVCACKKAHSTSCNYVLRIDGQRKITHSLMAHYVQNHRSAVPDGDLQWLNQCCQQWLNQKVNETQFEQPGTENKKIKIK